MERIAAANFAVSILRDDDLYTSTHYVNLQRLIQVLHKMKRFSEEITQYDTLQKFLADGTVEIIKQKFNELCKEYDASIDSLNITLAVDFKANAESDGKILKEEIEELSKFQEALLESMNTNDKKHMNKVIKQVSEISIVMQNVENEKGEKPVIQKKIDTIFNESPLPFKEYNETDITRGVEKDEDGNIKGVKITKYNKENIDFAFRTIDKDENNALIAQVKNQVAILKKIGDCQNVIRFYGYTEDEDTYYLVTEWAEKGNLLKYIENHGQDIEMELRLKFACDIAKGLNFLNSVKILHRDIRSENVVITDKDVAKITNFKLDKGFAGATGNLAVNTLSVRHNSPEVSRRGMLKTSKDKKKKYDTKSEVYSFGILLWEIAECNIAYKEFEDFLEITNGVINGYRESFTITEIPKKYQDLVNEAVDQNPGHRPTFAKMLVELQDIFEKYTSSGQSISHSNISTPVRKGKVDYESFKVKVDRVIEDHNVAAKNKDKKKLDEYYKLFDAYAKIGNLRAKYWKAYYITKGWSDHDHKDPKAKKENNKIAVELFKEVAEYDDKLSPEAQLRYALNTMSYNKGEAIEYLVKAAKNEHTAAMFNIATYYFSSGNVELGKYYMIMAANKKYPEAVDYCKKHNIPI